MKYMLLGIGIGFLILGVVLGYWTITEAKDWREVERLLPVIFALCGGGLVSIIAYASAVYGKRRIKRTYDESYGQ